MHTKLNIYAFITNDPWQLKVHVDFRQVTQHHDLDVQDLKTKQIDHHRWWLKVSKMTEIE